MSLSLDPFHGLPRGEFACIAADPPWPFETRSPKGRGRGPEAHYATMTIKDICALPVKELAAKDAWLFLWVAGPQEHKWPEVMRAWGFEYSAVGFTWVKTNKNFNEDQLSFLPMGDRQFHMGGGYTTRKNTERVYLGKRGKPQRLDAGVRELIRANVREHSRKPDEFFRRVERFCDGPRLELFARESRTGWTSWGNERTKFDGVAA